MLQTQHKTGFTLGKYAPFHQGHAFLINHALTMVDHLVVVIYPCDELAVPLKKRANWIRSMFPQVEVIEAINGPKDTGYSAQVIDIQNAFLRELLADYCFDYFFSSEAYGDHVSKALNCRDIRVDMSRQKVPISATKIRHSPIKYKRFLSNKVYKDLISKIVFLGAPSTGKSTLCQALAEKYKTGWVKEYGRDYWQEHQVDRRLTPEQLLHIAQTQNQMEDEQALSANHYLFCDTNAFTTWHFATHYHGDALIKLVELAKQSWQRYDLVVLCEEDIPYDDTWERSGDANRHEFQVFLKSYLKQHKIPYILVSGTVEKRVQLVERALEELQDIIVSC